MFISADQLLAHAIGDYLLQSHWMATEKTKASRAALLHVLAYSMPFLFFMPSTAAWLFIVGTHFVIDRWRLARYVVWLKNLMAPSELEEDEEGERPPTEKWRLPWKDCSKTGYPSDTPPWLATWLLIFADNILHLICNGIALKYL